ncbi:MAG: putative ABC transporter permease [Clostridium sp.]|uniref:putative ABC transporter permease n=1 Tax=Clostridium sp. TaxID=1506 RepID=UPI003EE79289
MDINTFVLVFFIYSFLGWCVEVTYQYFKHKTFINRGFLNGPFCPIYGFCATILVFCLSSISLGVLPLFILTSVLTSVVEYATSYFLEKCFSLKWWDYSEDPLNLQGRVCFHFSLAWGLGSVFVIKILNPLILESLNNLNTGILEFLAILIITYLSIDFCYTLYNLIMEKRKILIKNNGFDYTDKF